MKKILIIASSVVALLVAFAGGLFVGTLRTARAYRVYNYSHAAWQYGVANHGDLDLLTNSIALDVKMRGLFLKAAIENTALNYLVAMPKGTRATSDEQLLAHITEMEDELKDFNWTGNVFQENGSNRGSE